MRTSVHDDAALPALSLTDVVSDRDAARCLHDAPEADAAKIGQPAGQAAIRQRAVLGIVMAIHARGVVAGGTFRAARRGLRIVLAPGAARQFDLAGFRRLHERETKVLIDGGDLLGFRRQRRNPAIGRIDDHRGAHAGALHGPKLRVVGAGNVELAPARATLVAAELRGALPVQVGPLRRGEKFLVRILGGAL